MKKAKRILKKIDVTHVSIVKRPANKTSFFIKKEEEDNIFNIDVSIIKEDKKEWNIVKGLVAEPNEVDTQGDIIKSDKTIEESAHNFLVNYQENIDLQHDFISKAGELVESYVTDSSIKIGNTLVKKGSWIIAVKPSEEVKKGIEDGTFTGFSLAGKAEVEDIKKENIDLEKETFDEANEKKELYRYVNTLIDVLYRSIDNRDLSIDEKIKEIDNSLIQFSQKINEAIKNKQEVTKMEKQDVVNTVKETMKEVFKSEREKEDLLKSQKENEELKETVKKQGEVLEELKKNSTSSNAGKDGGENVKKEDSENYDTKSSI